MYIVMETVREPIPDTPWRIERYGYSLASIKDKQGLVVIERLNIAIAEYIVEAVNK